MQKYELKVDGIKWEGCVNRINNVLSQIKKVTSYNVSLKNKTITIEIKNEKVLKEVIEKINSLGFDVKE